MISLKNFPLAELLGVTPDVVYERQRALTRARHFSGAVEGKGPGSGVRATPHNVTNLLLSLLATDSLSDAVTKGLLLAGARPHNGKCPLTGETRFGRALKKILTNDDLAGSTQAIEVQRGRGLRGFRASARITYKTADGHVAFSDFGPPDPVDREFEVIAKLTGFGVSFIYDALWRVAAGKPLGGHTPHEGLDAED
jgi:hypothetical protein